MSIKNVNLWAYLNKEHKRKPNPTQCRKPNIKSFCKIWESIEYIKNQKLYGEIRW